MSRSFKNLRANGLLSTWELELQEGFSRPGGQQELSCTTQVEILESRLLE